MIWATCLAERSNNVINQEDVVVVFLILSLEVALDCAQEQWVLFVSLIEGPQAVTAHHPYQVTWML